MMTTTDPVPDGRTAMTRRGKRRRYTLLAGDERARVAAVAKDLYGAGHGLEVVAELLREKEGVAVSPGTVRALLTEADVTIRPPGWSDQQRAARWRQGGERS